MAIRKNRSRINAQPVSNSTVTISTRSPRLRVIAYLDQEPARIEEGYGGWEIVNRTRDVGFTEWRGISPMTMTLPIILDSLADEDSAITEKFIRNLERMARPEPAAGFQPPLVRVHGAVPARANVDWVINDLDMGDVLRRSSDGYRVRQAVVVSLLEYVRPEYAFSRDAAQRKALKAMRVKTITSREDDTLAKISKRVLGSVKRWKEIRDLNPALKDPRAKIKTGTRMKVPAG